MSHLLHLNCRILKPVFVAALHATYFLLNLHSEKEKEKKTETKRKYMQQASKESREKVNLVKKRIDCITKIEKPK